MGRATHNKNTQARISPGLFHKIQTSTTVLDSLSKPKTIDHKETLLSIQTIDNIYQITKEFAALSKNIIKQYENNELIIKQQEQLAEDVLHDCELSPAKDLYRAYKSYLKIRESRQLRRKAKSENKMLYPLYTYIKANPTIPKDITSISEKCAGIKYDLEHAQYAFKSNVEID